MTVSLDFAGGIAVIRIDGPLDAALPRVRALLPAVTGARAVVLFAGHGLCATDGKGVVRTSAAERDALSASLRDLRAGLADLRVPVVAGIGGGVIGDAAELALACDALVMAEDGHFVMVTGGQVLFGRRVSADEALRTGLVDRVVPASSVLRAAVEFANECKSAQAERKPCRIVAP